jgi:RHS repeat-associated protein
VASTVYNGCTQETLSVASSASNQITAFSYDASGNTLNDTHNAYAWNAESEIKTAAGVTYTYDGDGNRLQKSSGKIYWYGAGSQVLDESDSSGNITDEYVYFGGTRVSHRVVSTNALYFYGGDMLGTSRTIFTSSGVLCYDADFYPFGGERAYTNTCAQNYKFEGKERDTETGNDDFGARYYSSSFGRWTSPDWSAIPAPVPYADLSNPQTLNLYALTRDNPETFADLDGHCPNCVTAGIGAVAGAFIGMASEYIGAKIAHREVTGKDLTGAALKGAATGAAAGFTMGASLLVTTAAVAGANVIGGIADRSIRGQSSDKVLSPKEVAKDAAAGALGGAISSQAEGATENLANAISKMASTPGAMTAEDAVAAQADAALISLHKAAIAKTTETTTDLAVGVAQSASPAPTTQNPQPLPPQAQQPQVVDVGP